MTKESYRIAYVYVHEHFAGILKETDDGYSFKYDENYLSKDKPTAISLTFPLQK